MKILAYIPPVQAQSPARIYRGEGMLEKLHGLISVAGQNDVVITRENLVVEYVTPEMFNLDWAKLMRLAKEYDWLFLMRPAQPHEVQFAARLQGFGLKLWYDLDDDYSAVSPDNAAWTTFQRKDVIESWNWFLQHADLLTYSTEGLVKKFGTGRWLPNAIDDKIFDLEKAYPAPQKGLITWRGGGSHFQDLQDFGPVLTMIMGNTPEWFYHFIGFYPYWLAKGKNMRVTNYIHDYWYYMTFLEGLKPWGHVVPLSDNPFNRSKSCIAAMEAVYAGAIPVVPNFEEWQIPGALVYNDQREFLNHVQHLTTMDEKEHQERWTQAINWIRENRALSKVNQKRLEIIQEAHG